MDARSAHPPRPLLAFMGRSDASRPAITVWPCGRQQFPRRPEPCMPSSIRFRPAVPRPLKESFSHHAALGGQFGQNLLLLRDPFPILLHEGRESPLSGPGHRAARRGHPCEAQRSRSWQERRARPRLRNPARAGGIARPLGVDLGIRRDAVTDGILVDVAVLQVCDALVHSSVT